MLVGCLVGIWLFNVRQDIHVRASPIDPGSASAYMNEKLPPFRMHMQTHAKLPLFLHSLLLDFRGIVNMNWLLLKLKREIVMNPKSQAVISQTQPVIS